MTASDQPGLSDDWDRHWSAFGDAVAGNPATSYRTRLILQRLGSIAEGSVIVEIGCGQGELALHLAQLNPGAEVVGIDASAEGVRRAAATAAALGLSARFARRDLTEPAELSTADRRSATLAVCSEVLEHVDDPRQFLIHASEYLAPASRLVVTVPGGPRSTFDRHIGHRRHFSAARLRQLLESSGFDQVTVDRAGFPFFDLYRLVVIARGKHLIADVEQSDDAGLETGAAGAALRFFDRAFRFNLDPSPFGWQLVAEARFPPGVGYVIITRTPLRITLGGGGTDLPSYYEQFGGFVLSAAIDRYVYVAINRTFTDDYFLKYSAIERVGRIEDIEHPIIREALRLHPIGPSIELVSVADIPAGTGLGSSGTFTVGLLKGIYAYMRQTVTAEQIAAEACHIEMELLGRPVGKQDQYAAAYGGLECLSFATHGDVAVQPLPITTDTLHDLQEHLCMFFTGYSRSADAILEEQRKHSTEGDTAMIDSLHQVKALGLASRDALVRGDTSAFGDLMNQHWEVKKHRSTSMSNPAIDTWYRTGLENGALGGKLVGAGSGGFLLFYAKDTDRLRSALGPAGLTEVRFTFDHDGSVVVVRETDVECIILAGGRGRRMRPATDDLPKCLLPVAGRPFADWQLEWLAGQGVDRVVYSIGYRGDLVRRHIGDGGRFGLAVEYVDEGDEPLGTAGALRLAADRHALGPAPFVLYGDSYLSVSMAAVERAFASQSAPVLMTVYRDDEHLDRPNAVFARGCVTRYEKEAAHPPEDMVYTDYGLSVWRRSTIVEMVPAGIRADLAAVFTDLSLAGRLAGYEARDRFYEIGSAEGLRQLDDRLRGPAGDGEHRPDSGPDPTAND